MAQAARLMEVLFRLRARPRFTVQELADTLGVSRRTMLRDLHALSEMGIPLIATPGPGGGYGLARDQRLPPLALTVEEALGMLLSYEAFLQNAQSPFAAESLSAATKLRGLLPPDILNELDHLRRHVAIIERPRERAAPLLGELLRAALDRAHLRVVYETLSGRSERLIFPFGLFAQAGFWYCACYDYKREAHLSLRADRFISLARETGPKAPPHIPVATWQGVIERDDGPILPLRVVVTPRGMRRGDLPTLFGRLRPDKDGGGVIEGTIPQSQIDFYATLLLSAGADVLVEAPPELVAAMRRQIRTLAALYER
jgi:predicted DNA-binding transcriptional regulator YafY